jgi:hypothetical protein
MIIRAGMLDFFTAVVWLTMMFLTEGGVGLVRVSSQVSFDSVSQPAPPVLGTQLDRCGA